MRYLTHLNSLQAIESAVRNGSLRSAAEELGITAAAVGQRIRTLEDYLGAPLLERGRHSFKPTPMLLEALDNLEDGFQSLNAAAEQLQLRVLNVINIEADPDWAELWLVPRLARFQAEFPLVEVVIAEPGAGGAVEFAIRQSETVPEGGQELYTDYWLPVCSPDLSRRLVGFPVERQLEGLPLLHLEVVGGTVPAIGWPEWVRCFGHRLTGADRGFRYRRVTQALDAVRSNVGFFICGLSLILWEIGPQTLQIPFAISDGVWASQPYVLTSRRGVLVRPQARHFQEWLLREAEATRLALNERIVQGTPPERNPDGRPA